MKDIILLLLFLFKQFFGVTHLVTDFFFLFQSLNEPELGAGIDPGMALTPLLDEIRTHDLPIMSRYQR